MDCRKTAAIASTIALLNWHAFVEIIVRQIAVSDQHFVIPAQAGIQAFDDGSSMDFAMANTQYLGPARVGMTIRL